PRESRHGLRGAFREDVSLLARCARGAPLPVRVGLRDHVERVFVGPDEGPRRPLWKRPEINSGECECGSLGALRGCEAPRRGGWGSSGGRRLWRRWRGFASPPTWEGGMIDYTKG